MTQDINHTPMTLDAFTTLLDTYGSNLHRWPEAQADAASALLETSAAAQALHAEARALDDLLETVEGAPVSAAMMTNLLAIPATHPQDKHTHKTKHRPGNGAGLSFRFLFPRLVGVAASAAIVGFVIGATNVLPTETGLGIAAFDTDPAGSYDVVDLSDWAFPNGTDTDEAAL